MMPNPVPHKQPPSVEVDPRFPSGEWKGFWLQKGFPGRQWMRLVMQFRDGLITGEGTDCVGQFVLYGAYKLEDGRCDIIKTYVGSHAVNYNGSNEGDGKWLWGLWKVHTETGGFHLWPKGEKDPTTSELAAEEPLPAKRNVRLVLEPV